MADQIGKDSLRKVERYQNAAVVLIFIGAFLIICTIFIFLLKTTNINLGLPIDTNIFGNFGNIIGGVIGAIWSLSGVLLFYAALRLQREDLILQRDELAKSREIAQEQSKTFQIQRFENTFFNLLNLHHEIVKGMDLQIRETESLQGRDCFQYFYVTFQKHITARKIEKSNISDVINNYLLVYERHQSDLGHYFRNLYHIYKYIHFSEVDCLEKHRYANFIRAQLSSFELLLLFYNCLSKNGVEKFKSLVEEYQILKNIPLEHLVDQSHKEHYAESAFKKV